MAWTSPKTWSAQSVLSSTDMNTYVRDNFKAIGDAWTTSGYSVVLQAGTSPVTIGTGGTQFGSYILAGKLCIFRIYILFGTSPTIAAGTFKVNAPFAAAAVGSQTFPVFMYTTGTYRAGTALITPGNTNFNWISTANALVTNTSPGTWAANDYISISGTYEIA